jgi:hypothetical protein
MHFNIILQDINCMLYKKRVVRHQFSDVLARRLLVLWAAVTPAGSPQQVPY